MSIIYLFHQAINHSITCRSIINRCYRQVFLSVNDFSACMCVYLSVFVKKLISIYITTINHMLHVYSQVIRWEFVTRQHIDID